MNILNTKITLEQLKQIEDEQFFDYMMKAVADIEKRLIAVNAELHAD